MHCDNCHKDLNDCKNATLHRVNPKGFKGIFVCEDCGGKPANQEVKEIVEIIVKSRS